MREGIRVRELDNDEGNRLLRIVRRSSGSVVTWRRAQMVLLSAQGMDVSQIAKVAFTSPDRVREVLHNFNDDGFESLVPKYSGGRPPTFTLPERREVKKIALSRPVDHGLPFSTWSLSKLAEFLVAEGVVDDINPPDPDRAEAMIGAGDRDGAAQTFLREAAALPDEEIAVLRSLAPVWERITAGAHNGPRDQRALMTQPVDLDEVRRVRVPALILVGGEQDAPVYLDGLDEIEAALPDARREFIPGQRHMAPAFAPEAFAEHVAAFLADVTPT
ncbi:MAG TPA: helix-turn-helix domain-containing protein [Acidimicrobiales bacterium]|nr:helix-turn-helix domain-containing protein [Acidimicrobiales bacterium]